MPAQASKAGVQFVSRHVVQPAELASMHCSAQFVIVHEITSPKHAEHAVESSVSFSMQVAAHEAP